MLKGQKPILSKLLYLYFLDMLSYAMLSPLLALLFFESPYRISESKTPHFIFGLYLSTYSLIQIISLPAWGYISIIFNKTTVLKLSFLGNCLGYIIGAIGVAQANISYLFAGMIVAGLTGAHVSTTHALVSQESEKSLWAKNYSLFGASTAISFILGPQITSVLMQLTPSKDLAIYIFLCCAAISLFNFALVVSSIRESPVNEHTSSNANKQPLLSNFGKEIKTIFLFQFFIYLGWYLFIKFFQVYLLEALKFSPQESCLGISYLGFCCAFWQGLRFYKPKYFQFSNNLPFAVFFMAASMLSFLYIEGIFATLTAISCLAFAYSLIAPSALSILLNQKQLPKEMKTSLNQSLQSIAKIIAPLTSGILISFTGGNSAILGFSMISLSALLILLHPKVFN